MVDFDKAFKETPAAFSEGVSNHLKTLQEMEEKPVKRKSYTAVLIAALLIVALAATAFAVANRARLFDFFDSWREQEIPQTPTEFTQVLSGDAPLLSASFDDLIVTVTEAAGDGDWYYFNTTIELKPGVAGRINAPGSEPIGSIINTKDGQSVYFVRDYMMHEDRFCDSGDWKVNEDGSISSVNVIKLVEAADTARMSCYITYVKAEPGALPDETGTHTTLLPFEIPMPAPVETWKVAEPVSLEELGLTLDELYFKKAQDATYCFTYLRYEGGAAVDYKLPYGYYGLTLRVLREDGEILIPRLQCEWIQDTYFSGYNALELETLPERVILEVIDENSEKVYGKATITLTRGELALDELAKYREHPEMMLDLRDMYFPWSDIPFVTDYAYISTGEDSAPVYLDPRDPSTLVGTYYSGLELVPNITFNGWTSVYIDDWGNTKIKGYIRSEFLVRAPEEARPGIPVAVVNGLAGESVDVRIRPDEASAVQAMVVAQDRVLIIGEMNGWYHIAREEDDFTHVIGFVPTSALTPLEERVSMR